MTEKARTEDFLVSGNSFPLFVKENLMVQVEAKGKLFDALLIHPTIKSKRRFGLLIALEFENFDQNKKIIGSCIERGVLTDWFLFAPHCMRIAPPLIISEEEIKVACGIILQSVAE